jgi:hypothetical protein
MAPQKGKTRIRHELIDLDKSSEPRKPIATYITRIPYGNWNRNE